MTVLRDFSPLRRLLAGMLLATAAGTALACPGDGGPTCGSAASAPASQPATAAVNVGAGNPINIMTGNKYQREDDLPALPGVLGLELVRHYNSRFSGTGAVPGLVGRGWKLSYETELSVAGDTIQVFQADGSSFMFRRDLVNQAVANGADPANGNIAIRRNLAGRDEYLWRWADGRELSFDQRGKLVQIKAATGEILSLMYDAKGLLVKVTDPQGRSLRLSYLDRQQAERGDRFRGVQSIDSPVGRFSYEYGNPVPKGAAIDQLHLLANLVRVRYPAAGEGRQYHYEDAVHPTYLTGITIEGQDSGKAAAQRYATFGYQADGRAVLSTHANDVDKVTLNFERPGLTVVTNSLGQQTSYRYATVAGDYRLLEVRGAGCALCGPANERYGYDKLGRLVETTKLNVHGNPVASIRSELDYSGRPVRIERVGYRAGRESAAQLVARYEYGPEPGSAPIVIARPSVVAGKESSIRFAYNAMGQLVAATETGWAPAVDGKGEPQRIERSKRYAYELIGGRSVLVRLDGPLPNGGQASPLDSDITTVTWDQRGANVLAITAPGGAVRHLGYDQAGRVVRVHDGRGADTVFGYDARGRQDAITVGAVTRRTRFDMAGNPVEQGYTRDGKYQAVTRSGFDGAGRNIWNASALGMLQRLAFDTEGRLLERVRETSRIRQAQSFVYDEAGRLSASTDASGSEQRIIWNDQDQPEVTIDALGRERHYRYNAIGQLETEAGPDGASAAFERDETGQLRQVVAPNGAATRYVRDDFGRELAVWSADSGVRLRRYDAANRIVESSDALGHRASYQYDAGGRLQRQVILDATAQDPARRALVTEWEYDGGRLHEVRHANQSERYRYDSEQRLSGKTVWLRLDSGQVVSSVTEYRYDELGRMRSVSLPDGSSIDYVRNGQGQVVAMERSRVQTGWLRWLMPAQTIVSGLERDLKGLRRIVYGNGIEALQQRSEQGVLARLVYRRQTSTAYQPTVASNLFDLLLQSGPAHAAGQTTAQQPAALLEHRYLWDLQGNLLQSREPGGISSYGYDRQDRVIVAAHADYGRTGAASVVASTSYARYFYDAGGNRLLSQEQVANQDETSGHTVRTSYQPHSNRRQEDAGPDSAEASAIRYDAAGQPVASGGRDYTWNALGQLVSVGLPDGGRAQYRYNYRGERIAKTVGAVHTYYLYEGGRLAAELNEQGQVVREYLYLADQPVAILDREPGTLRTDLRDSAWERFTADLCTVWAAWWHAGEELGFIHTNHLGAPELVTDSRGAPVWQAAYLPFGQLIPAGPAIRLVGGVARAFRQQLRLPGQYEDEETGLYYNHHRYYDPRHGRYLTPDPLGLRAGMNRYAYVSGNPLKYVDPDGLILFAFDGTGNDESDPATLSNVVRFRKLYQDGTSYYITGPGTKDPATGIENPFWRGGNAGDVADAFTGKARISAMIDYLASYSETVDDDTAFDIDITGFSRGSAEARDFANQIVSKVKDGYYHYKNASGKEACQKVNFRFMGLFDTVLSTHTGDYQLQIPDAFQFVSHATALNEYRGALVAFPSESILNNPDEQKAGRTERGFLGAHSDIGGGFPQQDLAKVAMAWMVDQAKAAGVKMAEPDRTIIANPVLHDKSGNLLNGAPDGGPTASSEDRDVRYGNGQVVKQRRATSGLMTYADTVPFISYKPNPNTFDTISGTVDARAYLKWLNDHGYGINMTVQ